MSRLCTDCTADTGPYELVYCQPDEKYRCFECAIMWRATKELMGEDCAIRWSIYSNHVNLVIE